MLTITDVKIIPNRNDVSSIWNSCYKNFSNESSDDSIYYFNYELSINIDHIRKMKIVGMYQLANINIVFEMFAILSSNGDIYPFFVKYYDLNNTKNIFWKELVLIDNINCIIKGDDIIYKHASSFNNNFVVNKYFDKSNIYSIYNFLLPKHNYVIQKYSVENIYKDFGKLYIPESSQMIRNAIENVLLFENTQAGYDDAFSKFEYILFNMDMNKFSLDIVRKFKLEIENIEMINAFVKNKNNRGQSLLHSQINNIENYYGNNKNTLMSFPCIISFCQNLLLFPIAEIDVIFKDALNTIDYHINYAYHPIEINTLKNITKNDLAMLMSVIRNELINIAIEFGYHKHNKLIDVHLIKNYNEQVRIEFYIDGEKYPYIHEFNLFFIPLVCDGIAISFNE